MRRLGALTIALALLLPVGPAWAGDQAQTVEIVTANVGNTKPACQPYLFNLCYLAVEERIADRLQARGPALIALQEVPTLDQCKAMLELDPQKICHGWRDRTPQEPVRRLVGPDYTVACDARSGFECVAVHTAAGSIDGCSDDALCRGFAEPVPAPAGCDPGFTVSAISATIAGQTWRVVNLHPPSSNVTCRAEQVEAAFADLTDGSRNLVLGDANLDPYRSSDESVAAWEERVGPGSDFAYLSGKIEHDPPYPTQFTWESANLYPTAALTANVVLGSGETGEQASGERLNPTLDHVVSDAGSGTCQTLGEQPGTARLDGGAGTDHRALSCTITLPAS